MKKLMLSTLTISVIILTIGLLNHSEHIYKRQAVMVSDTIAQDNQGNLWKFDDTGFSKGDKVILTMNDNMTENIHDDVIEKVVKA